MNNRLHLRCKTSGGQYMLNNLSTTQTVRDLKQAISSLTQIDASQMKLYAGYPPKSLDLSNDNRVLNTLFFNNQETLIVEELPLENSKLPFKRPPTAEMVPGILMRKVVPANNSCLFTSIYFAVSNGEYSEESGQRLRHIIADTVASDMDTYSEAFLEKPNKEYCTWILNEDNWGGGIEISILSQYYKVEIVAIDTQNVSMMRFGEDADYKYRILLIYDGIHYDPLTYEPLDKSKEVKTIFLTSDRGILDIALEVAQEANSSHQYTDVQNFSLKCLTCSKGLKGQGQARQHAQETGHTNFGET